MPAVDESTFHDDLAQGLANATATWATGSAVGVFDLLPLGAGDILREPTFQTAAAQLGTAPPVRGTAITINGTDYTVGTVDDDGTGWVTLSLRRGS